MVPGAFVTGLEEMTKQTLMMGGGCPEDRFGRRGQLEDAYPKSAPCVSNLHSILRACE